MNFCIDLIFLQNKIKSYILVCNKLHCLQAKHDKLHYSSIHAFQKKNMYVVEQSGLPDK